MEEFNYPSSSSNSQSVPLNFRIPAELHRMLEELFYSKKWPYRVFSDLLRHAVIRHAEFLNNHSGATHNTDYLRAMALVLNKDAEITEFQGVMDKLRIQVHAYQENGFHEDAARIVNTMLSIVRKMPETQSKEMYGKRIRAEFGQYEVVEGEVGEIVGVVVEGELVSYDPEDMERE